MAVCEATRPAPLRCPTAPDILASALKLLPKGRAWQSHEGGPRDGAEIAFQPDAFSSGFATRYRKPSWLLRFWKSVAEVYAFLNQRLCDLRLEFWCATHKETHDLWMAEYGLPDACDPFPDLCAKVAAIGGTRCDYYAGIAARAGWSIACVDQLARCGAQAGFAKPGRAKPGGQSSAKLQILVDLDNSTAYTGGPRRLPLAGKMKAGRPLACGPDISPLECILSRVVHAEIQIAYVTN
ncbi:MULTISPECIES: hypothetical protein [unclassified Bradyrhizobium]|uniref:hypothetical protein n=1 Tax=unclassified Bradyrhizobium TaxID=2631580 RepID=UPI0029161E46|nr:MULTISPECIES: hypothetical protein [unclassified Bradyrhizobium]